MLSNKIKNFFATFLLAVLIFLQIAAPLNAFAIETVPVTVKGSAVPIWPGLPNISNKIEKLWETITSTDWLLKNVGEPAVRVVVRAAIVSITQQVVNWISANGGNNVGFVGNFEKTLGNELDDRAGEFLQRLDMVNFCGDIGAYLKLNLRTPAGGLKQRAKCSLSAIVSNVQNFYDNFQNGGWEAFLKTNVDIQNNTAGAFLITLDAKIAAETRRKEEFGAKYAKSSILGVGKKEMIDCIPIGDKKKQAEIVNGYQRSGVKEIGTENPDEKCFSSYQEQTPGVIIEQTLKDANKTGIDLGVNAKFIDEAVVAPIVTALLNRTITAAHGIFGKSPNTNVSYDSPGLFDGYKELGPSQDSVRTHAQAAIFTAQGAVKATSEQTLAARKEINSLATTPERKLELARKTENLMVKNQSLLAEQSVITGAKLSSYYAISQDDVGRIDDQISQSLNRVEPISAEVGSSPYAVPTGKTKTDTLNELGGSRTILASQLILIRQAIKEVSTAAGILSPTGIVGEQETTITSANQISAEMSKLAADISIEQSRVSALRQKLLNPQGITIVNEVKTKEQNIIAQADTINQELNGLADLLAAEQTQVGALRPKLINPQDGHFIDEIIALEATIIAELRQLAAIIDKLSADLTTEQTQVEALRQRILSPEGVALVTRLNLQNANIVAEGDKTNAEISTLTDAISNEQAQVSVLRQQLVSTQAGQLISDITTLTDAISNEQAQVSVLRQQLVSVESAQLISQISQNTDIIASEQAQVSVLRQQLHTADSAQISAQISETTDIVASEQAQVSVLRQQLSITTDPIITQQIQTSITGLLTDIAAKQLQIGTLRLELNSTAGAVNTQVAALLADIQAKQLQIGTLRKRLVAIGDTVNTQISNLLADILIKQSRISTLRTQLLAIGGSVNSDIAGLLSDILIKRSRISTLRVDLVTILDLGRFAAQIASSQDKILPAADQIRNGIGKIGDDLKTKQTQIKNLMQKLLVTDTVPSQDLTQTTLENQLTVLTAAVEKLQESDKQIQTAYNRLKKVTTLSEITGESGAGIDAANKANDLQSSAGQTMQSAFGFIDHLHNPDFIPQSISTPTDLGVPATEPIPALIP